MAGLNSRYIIAPNLQTYFVDKDTGLPLAGGQVFSYTDNSKSVQKPIYTLTVSGSDYTYTPLSDPIILGIAGTMVDGDGNDILPYYDTQDTKGNAQNYYIEVYSAGGVLQFTRNAFPNIIGSSSLSSPFGYNFVRNSQFYSWNNTNSFINVGLGSATMTDFTADDWLYTQNDATQTIGISRISINPALGLYGSPTYALSYTNSGGANQTVNYLYQTYQSVSTLSGQTVSFSMLGNATILSGIIVNFVQNFGTGGSPSAQVSTTLAAGSLNSFFNAIEGESISIPSIQGKTLGSNGDDYCYLQINFPSNTVTTINITNINLNIGTSAQSFPIRSNDDLNKATNYDNPNSIFRTGDTKMTIRTTNDPGWVLMNDGTIGNSGSNSDYIGLQYKALYSMIWNNIGNAGAGGNPAYAPMYASNGTTLTTYGASSDADWYANKGISLTKALGRVMAGAAPSTFTAILSISSSTTSSLIIPNSGLFIINATPVMFTGTIPSTGGPGQIVAGTVYYINSTGGVYVSMVDAINALNNISSNNFTFTPASYTNFYINLASFSYKMGEFYGEENHSQSLAELTNHSHPPQPPLTNFVGFTGGTPTFPLISAPPNNNAAAAAATGLAGGNTNFNIFQPTVFMNVMMKT